MRTGVDGDRQAGGGGSQQRSRRLKDKAGLGKNLGEHDHAHHHRGPPVEQRERLEGGPESR